MILNLELNAAEMNKLIRLAQKRKKTPTECIREWLAAANADADTWVHPASPPAKQKAETKS